MIRGYLVGDFDLFNVGDLDVVAQARQQCDRLSVGVLSDEDFQLCHGQPPVVPLDERLEIVRNLRGVDAADVFLGAVVPGATAEPDYDLVFADVRYAGSPWTTGAVPIVALSPLRRTGSEVLRHYLGRHGEIAEAS